MATSGKEVKKNAQALKRELGLRGTLNPGDLTKKAREMQAGPKTKLPSSKTRAGVAIKGLI